MLKRMMLRLASVHIHLCVPFMLQYFTICVPAQKIKHENQVRDKEVASRKLESEITHLNNKKSMHETLWTSIGKTREDALKDV